jgi:hypothetical protein
MAADRSIVKSRPHGEAKMIDGTARRGGKEDRIYLVSKTFKQQQVRPSDLGEGIVGRATCRRRPAASE